MGANIDKNQQDKKQDNFFKIPENLITELKEAPNGDKLLSGIEELGKTWESNWTKKRMEEAKEVQQVRDEASASGGFKNKAEAMDKLLANPRFTDFLQAEAGGGYAPQNNNNSGNNTQNDPFAEYEDGEAIGSMVSLITKQVTDNVQQMMQPVMQNMVQDKEASDINSVRTFIEQQKSKGVNLPEVDDNAIKFNMRKHNMGAMDAYKLATSNYLMSNPSRSLMEQGNNELNDMLGNQDNNQQQQNNQQQGNQNNQQQQNNNQQGDQNNQQNNNQQKSSDAMLKPGAGAQSLLLKSPPSSVDEKLNLAKSLTKDGAQPQSTRTSVTDTMNLMNETLGTNMSVNDL